MEDVKTVIKGGAEGGSRTRTSFRTTDFKSYLGCFAQFLSVPSCIDSLVFLAGL